MELYEQQLALECKQLLPSGRVRGLPCDNPDHLARISVVRFFDGSGEHIHLREDADPDTEELVSTLDPALLLSLTTEELSRRNLIRHFSGRTGIFGGQLSTDQYVGVDQYGHRFVIRVGDDLAAVAFSAREDAKSAELSVETAPAYRRGGFGRRVAAAWANAILSSGRTAFYSYDFTNNASAALARSLKIEFKFEPGTFDPTDASG